MFYLYCHTVFISTSTVLSKFIICSAPFEMTKFELFYTTLKIEWTNWGLTAFSKVFQSFLDGLITYQRVY